MLAAMKLFERIIREALIMLMMVEEVGTYD
jgi:hypothetical protein